MQTDEYVELLRELDQPELNKSLPTSALPNESATTSQMTWLTEGRQAAWLQKKKRIPEKEQLTRTRPTLLDQTLRSYISFTEFLNKLH